MVAGDTAYTVKSAFGVGVPGPPRGDEDGDGRARQAYWPAIHAQMVLR